MEPCREHAQYKNGAYSLVEGGVRDVDPVTELVEEAEYAYHQAAQASGPQRPESQPVLRPKSRWHDERPQSDPRHRYRKGHTHFLVVSLQQAHASPFRRVAFDDVSQPI